MYNSVTVMLRNGDKIIFEDDNRYCRPYNYSYDNLFFSVKKDDVNIAMYSVDSVVSVRLR